MSTTNQRNITDTLGANNVANEEDNEKKNVFTKNNVSPIIHIYIFTLDQYQTATNSKLSFPSVKWDYINNDMDGNINITNQIHLGLANEILQTH